MSGSKAVPLTGELGARIEDCDLPELLHSVSAERRTGRLELQTDDVAKQIYLAEGRIVFAASSSPDDRLSTYLLQRDQLALDDLRKLSSQVRPGVRFGTLLVQHGLLPSSELVRAVHGHVQAIVLSAFRWSRAHYTFVEEPLRQAEAILLSVPTARLIVDGVETVSSWIRISKGLGSLDARFTVVAGNELSLRSADLDTGSLELLAALRHPKSVEEVCAASELPDIAICRKLWAFRVVGWIRPADDASELDQDFEGLGMILGDESGH